MLRHTFYSVLPSPLRIQGRSFFGNYLLDMRDIFRGTADPAIPPRHLNVSGRGDFRALGEHNVTLCRTLADLKPDDAVLDVGCGIGRTAVALTSFLLPQPGENSAYIGLDVIPFAIEWCRTHIAHQYPHFSFLHADIRNALYNPSGSIPPDRYVFPFAAARFTFSLATSVFTHLLPAATAQYLTQIARTLQPKGRFLSTWFLLDETTRPGLDNGIAIEPFSYRFHNHAQQSLTAPERAVAYDLSYVEHLFEEAGLEITSVYHGGWSGTKASIDSAQDVIVARVCR